MSRIPDREEALFADALEHPPADRGAFLAQACGADVSLLARLTTLLAAHEAPDPVIASPPVPVLSGSEEKPGDRIGRYKLLQKIGEGGCGVVWMANQEEPVRRRVALKVIKLGMDTKEVVVRFEAERQALARMDHPNIAQVYDAGATDTGRPFFVMELVRGIPITRYCDENQLAPAARLELFTKVCHGVQHAHQKGVVHRDLKPSNILVTLNDGVPTPKIIDFGIAKATQGRLTDATLFTAFEQFIGTPVYMSPEQAEMSSLDVDTRSDIYSLGILLYELLTGRPPFDAKAFANARLEEIRHHIRDDEPPKPSVRWRTLAEADRTTLARLRSTAPGQLSVILRGDLDWIVMRCIEKDRNRRFDTASGVAADIQRHLRNEPVVARPPKTGYLLRKWIRRHRAGFAASAGMAAVLVLGATVSIWQAWRATQAEQTAVQAQQDEARERRKAEAQEFIARRRAYAADMMFAGQAVRIGSLDHARRLLERQRPAPGQRDLRGWEWRHLWEASRVEVADLHDTVPAIISSFATSADGNWLAGGRYWWPAGQLGGVVDVWDLRRGRKLELPIGNSSTKVAFSPVAPLLAISGHVRASDQNPARAWIELWDVATWRKERQLEISERCAALKFSADGERLVAATFGDESSQWSPEITHWRVRDGHQLRSVRAPPTCDHRKTTVENTEFQFAISPDLSAGVYRAEDPMEIRLVDLNTGGQRWRRPVGGNAVGIEFSPDGRLLVTGTWGQDIGVWNAATGAEVGSFLGYARAVRSFVFWPDGKRLASIGGTFDLWDVENREHLRTFGSPRFRFHAVALLPDSGLLVSSQRNGGIRKWNTNAAPARRFAAKELTNVGAWRFSDDSRSVFVAHRDGTITVLTVPGFQPERKISLALPASLRDGPAEGRMLEGMTFATQRPLVGVTTREGVVWVFDFEQGSLVAEIRITSTGLVAPFAFVDHGNRVILLEGSRTPGIFREWDLSRGRASDTWQAPERHRSIHFALTPDERRILMLQADDGTGLIRDRVTRTSHPTRLSENVTHPSFSADGRLLAAVGEMGAKIFRFPSYEEIATFSGTPYPVRSVAFSPDGSRLATGSSHHENVRIWDVESQEAVLALGEGKGGNFNEIGFSPDGKVLASLSHTGEFQLWHAPSFDEIAVMESARPAAAQKK